LIKDTLLTLAGTHWQQNQKIKRKKAAAVTIGSQKQTYSQRTAMGCMG